MADIKEINFLEELQEAVGSSFKSIGSSFAMSYQLLHEFAKTRIIPLIQQFQLTIATVELTTCGLITDVLTSSSGASHFFILGMTPYSNEMKIKLGIGQEELLFGGHGIVSPKSAKTLAIQIKEYSGAKIGLAETGLLTSTELKKRRTSKKAGEVYSAIAINNEVLVKKLSIQTGLKRKEMRQESAFRVLQYLESVLISFDF